MTFPLPRSGGAPAPVFFHVGVVVPDLRAGMADLTAALGLRWREEASLDMAVRSRDGVRPVRFHYVYSLDGPPYVELVESVDASIWQARDPQGGHAHHLGYWSEDLAGDARRLELSGFVREVSDAAQDGGFEAFTYHRAPGGPLIEHVSTSMRPHILGDEG